MHQMYSSGKEHWYEQWERADAEALNEPRHEYDTNITHINRIFGAVADFEGSRLWHPDVHCPGLDFCWAQFLIFAGLLQNPPVYRRKPRDENLNTPDERADIPRSDTDILVSRALRGGQRGTGRSRGRRWVASSGWHSRAQAQQQRHQDMDSDDENIAYNTEEEIQKMRIEAADSRLTRLNEFLDDPERAVRIFCSWYMIERCFVFIKNNLVTMPRLMLFFLRFLIRHRVLPEHHQALESAISFLPTAAAELPLTASISQALPDAFSESCEHIFGSDDTRTPAEVQFFENDVPAEGLQRVEYDPWATDAPEDRSGFVRPPLRAVLPAEVTATHQRGVREQSMRRIKATIACARGNSEATGGGDPAQAVEDALYQQFGRVVLEPWLDWDKNRESLLCEPVVTFLSAEDHANTEGEDRPEDIHNPSTDDITILVEPSILGIFKIGMGMGGEWTEVVRRQAHQGVCNSHKSERSAFWYVVKILEVIPSYYVQAKLGEGICSGL